MKARVHSCLKRLLYEAQEKDAKVTKRTKLETEGIKRDARARRYLDMTIAHM